MVYMCHIFPVQSIIDGHLGWFQVFAKVMTTKAKTEKWDQIKLAFLRRQVKDDLEEPKECWAKFTD